MARQMDIIPSERIFQKWKVRMPTDMYGKEFKVGDFVAKAYRTCDLRVMKVTKIVDDKVYLGKSTNPIYYPNCVLILDDGVKYEEG